MRRYSLVAVLHLVGVCAVFMYCESAVQGNSYTYLLYPRIVDADLCAILVDQLGV